MNDRITSWELQAIHEDLQIEDLARRRANRLYVAHLDAIGAPAAWQASVEAQHRIIRLEPKAS